MTPVSRRKLSKATEKQIIDTFITELVKITNKKTLESFISLLLSESERIMLSKRLVTFVLVEKQVPDSQIAKALNLTTVTVAKLRFAYWLIKERKEPAQMIIQQPKLSIVIMNLLQKILTDYAIPAMRGRIPRNIGDILKLTKKSKYIL